MIKIVRTATVASSINILLKGQLGFLRERFKIIAVSGGKDDLSEIKEREKVDVFEIKMKRGISLINDFLSLIRVVFFLWRTKPTVIHSITPKAGLLSMLAGKITGVPVRIHTFTGLIFPTKSGFVQKILIKMDQLLCWAATNIYPEGNGVKNDLIRYKITSKHLKVLANGNVNGIDLEYFSTAQIFERNTSQLKRELNIREKDFVFIFVGRLVSDKGINELVLAFRQNCVQLPYKTCKLLLVGSFETEDPLSEETLKEIEGNSDIISVGFQKDVRPYFAISHALVFPSYREGFPNVVIQAGAMGLPSIVSDINGCNEIIIEGENGTIIPVKNTQKLIEAMGSFVEKKDYYESLKLNARSLIESRYEQSLVWNALLEEYNTLLKQKGISK